MCLATKPRVPLKPRKLFGNAWSGGVCSSFPSLALGRHCVNGLRMKRIQDARLYGIVDLGYVTAENVESMTEQLCLGGVDVLQLRRCSASALTGSGLLTVRLAQARCAASDVCALAAHCQWPGSAP